MNLIELIENCVLAFNARRTVKEVRKEMVRDMGVNPIIAEEILHCFNKKNQLVTLENERVTITVQRKK